MVTIEIQNHSAGCGAWCLYYSSECYTKNMLSKIGAQIDPSPVRELGESGTSVWCTLTSCMLLKNSLDPFKPQILYGDDGFNIIDLTGSLWLLNGMVFCKCAASPWDTCIPHGPAILFLGETVPGAPGDTDWNVYNGKSWNDPAASPRARRWMKWGVFTQWNIIRWLKWMNSCDVGKKNES